MDAECRDVHGDQPAGVAMTRATSAPYRPLNPNDARARVRGEKAREVSLREDDAGVFEN